MTVGTFMIGLRFWSTFLPSKEKEKEHDTFYAKDLKQKLQNDDKQEMVSYKHFVGL